VCSPQSPQVVPCRWWTTVPPLLVTAT
jgi:hypothetical protein